MNVIEIVAILWMLLAWGCAEWLIYEIDKGEEE